jgi:hypothetical protein
MARHRRSSRAFAVATTALLGSACAVGPDFVRPAALEVGGYTSAPLALQTASSDVAGGEAQRFAQGLDIPGQWWTLFHSAALNTIKTALTNNPTLPAAEAALRQARENVYAQQGAFCPTVAANFSPSRNKTATGALSPASASGNPYYSLYTDQVSVSYMPDVFGGTRRQLESLAAKAEFQQFQLEATFLTLTSNVVARRCRKRHCAARSPPPKKTSKSRPPRSTSCASNSSSGKWSGPTLQRLKRHWRRRRPHCRRCRSDWRCSAIC